VIPIPLELGGGGARGRGGGGEGGGTGLGELDLADKRDRPSRRSRVSRANSGKTARDVPAEKNGNAQARYAFIRLFDKSVYNAEISPRASGL